MNRFCCASTTEEEHRPNCSALSNRREGERRDITKETNAVKTGTSRAVSSHKALFFHLISPHTLRRLAKRKTDGGIKYGTVQWRQGINDVEYVADRLNHMFAHMCNFLEDGNEKDDNLGAILWAVDALIEVERLAPEVLKEVVGTSKLFGESATAYHEREKERRARS